MVNVKQEFFKSMRSKAFYIGLRKVLNGKEQPNDLTLAKYLSSFLTHSLIELSYQSVSMYEILDVKIQANTLNDFIQGKISQEEVLNIHKKLFGEYFK